MRFFAGLAAKEIAVVLKTSEATVRRDWVIAKAWLFRYLEGQANGMTGGAGNPDWEDIERAIGGRSGTAGGTTGSLPRAATRRDSSRGRVPAGRVSPIGGFSRE